MNNQPIGIFDSGVGGLSILIEVKKLLPNETFIFLADQAFMPYGEKSKEELLDRVTKTIQFFKEKNVKAVIIACNTATVYTIDEMREMFDLPLIGTVPAVKTIASLSKSKKAAVLSTPATAKSPYLKKLTGEFAPDVEIFRIGGSNLEELVESGDLDSPEIETVLRNELIPLVEKGVDAIALGCTHYPFLRDIVERIVGPNVAIVDSGEAIAKRAKDVFSEHNIFADKNFGDTYFTTGNAEKFHQVAEKLMHTKISKPSHIDLS